MDKQTQSYLLFRLYGPMASWGETAVGEHRPSADHPGKSALNGLLAAALGIRRDQTDALNALVQGYRFAVRVDHPGWPMRDYHTVQVPPQVALKKHPINTRRDELLALEDYQLQKPGSGTLLTAREYRCDAHYSIALTATDDAPFDLKTCRQALLHPVWPLYLGRKSCPLGLPMKPAIVEANHLKAAFEQLSSENMTCLPIEAHNSVYWEDGFESGFDDAQDHKTFTRRDRPDYRSNDPQRWHFSDRLEHHISWSFDPQGA